jgi:regulator of nonsense transcripts 1
MIMGRFRAICIIRFLGQQWQKTVLDVRIPDKIEIPGLPKLNFYQEEGCAEGLKRAIMSSFKVHRALARTVTSASIVYHLVRATKRKILVCAPSNVVVDMLAQRISQTGVKVVRFCSKSR